MKIETQVNINDRVIIDDCAAVIARVTGFQIFARGIMVEIAWWNNGALMTATVAEDRLAMPKPDDQPF